MSIQLSQIIFQIINFGVVMGALVFLLYKPILKILDERSNKIAQAQKQAEATLAEKEELEDIKKKTKQQAEKQANEIIEKAKQTAEEQVAHILDQAKVAADEKQQKLMDGWKKERMVLEQTMKSEFNEAVLAVTEKVLGNILDKKAQSKLIDQEIKSILKTL